MPKYTITLLPQDSSITKKPVKVPPSTNPIIEANSNFDARRLAEAQYGALYKIGAVQELK